MVNLLLLLSLLTLVFGVTGFTTLLMLFPVLLVAAVLLYLNNLFKPSPEFTVDDLDDNDLTIHIDITVTVTPPIDPASVTDGLHPG